MIYLDSAATTKPCRAAADAVMKTVEVFGNPSSLHGAGLEAEKMLEQARKKLAARLGADEKGIYFTSGGTEANNLAVLGAAHMRAKRGKHIVTTAIEHPSVLAACGALEQEGFEVTYVMPDENGVVAESAVAEALRPDTVLVSIMHVNNETGMIQPVDRLGAVIKKHSPLALYHCDCVQSFCKLPINAKAWGLDMVSISAHKIHGFKGTGALYTAEPRLKPLLFGGEQQNGLRPGTENMAGICAFAAAADEMSGDTAHISAMRERLKNGILKNIDNVLINGDGEQNSGNILNVSFLGVKAEILLHSLERYGIYVSTGSACSSHKPQPSHVLTGMGLDKKRIDGAVRISLDEDITADDIDKTLDALIKETAQIRKYVR